MKGIVFFSKHGQVIRKIQCFIGEGRCGNAPVRPEQSEGCQRVGRDSKSYAQQACGLTRGVIGQELRPGNIWETREKGALMDHPSVTQMTLLTHDWGHENYL